jgi:hypothetical protein
LNARTSEEMLYAAVGRLGLGQRGLTVWKLVSQSPEGVHFSTLREALVPTPSFNELRNALKSLREYRYVEFKGNGSRWGLWHITGKAPLGETLPAWFPNTALQEAGEPAAGPAPKPAAAKHKAEVDEPFHPPVSGVPRGVPNSVFALGAMVNVDRAATREAHFSLSGDGVFTIEHGEAEPIALPPSVTRQMFRYLDRLGGLDLGRLVQEQQI